ncbi:MAG TPA: helix-turn-helix transcriptional regulator, partial [Polyangiaceae bacterium]|nr:helix-turn-helix transcriptional regulator [Polyangiaceae bacterium]
MSDGTSTLLSANIKRLREEAGLSQKALAEVSGVPRPTIAHLESGQANPTLTVVLKVAAALGVGVDNLVEPAESPVLILGGRTLPTQKTSRVRRVQL